MKKSFIASLSLSILIFFQAEAQQKLPFIKGIYGNPENILKAGYSFEELGVNAIFVRSTSLTENLYKQAKAQGVKVFVEFPTLNGKEYLQKHKEAWPINEKGERAESADWFMGICPTDTGFRQERIMDLRRLLNNFSIDGIWLDYLHWHAQFETPNPILPETCFCDRCLSKFSKEMNVPLTTGSASNKALYILKHDDVKWRRWRSNIIVDWVEDLKQVVRGFQPSALLGIFHCAWNNTEHNGAIYRNLGLDLKRLAGTADVLSPMLFHQMMGKEKEWVGEYAEWLQKESGQFKTKIWPIVQAHNKPQRISPQEFMEVMKFGAEKPSSGIMMFSEQSLLEDPEKIKVMKTFFLNPNGFP